MGQVKNFFVNYRRRFNLEEVLQEWEAEQGTRAPNGDSATSGEEGKNSSTTPSGKSTDEEDEEVRGRCCGRDWWRPGWAGCSWAGRLHVRGSTKLLI